MYVCEHTHVNETFCSENIVPDDFNSSLLSCYISVQKFKFSSVRVFIHKFCVCVNTFMCACIKKPLL
jgi:hypothetical protein